MVELVWTNLPIHSAIISITTIIVTVSITTITKLYLLITYHMFEKCAKSFTTTS